MFFDGPPEPDSDRKPVIDMKPVLAEIPPIDGVFSPDEEVSKLLSVPKNERRQAVNEFKRKLAVQEEAWGVCRTNIEERIESNPDLPKREMVEVVDEFAKHYGFPDKYIEIAKLLIDDYVEMHKRIIEMIRETPNSIDLISKITGIRFVRSDVSRFKVTAGLVSVDISCSKPDVDRLFYMKSDGDPVEDCGYDAFARHVGGDKPLYYIVIGDGVAEKDPDFQASIIIHEREHQKNSFFAKRGFYRIHPIKDNIRKRLDSSVYMFLKHKILRKFFSYERDFDQELFERYQSIKNSEEKTLFLSEFMRLRRERALNRVKDEIIARKSEVPVYTRRVYNIFLDSGNYDFLRSVREWDGGKNDDLWQKTARKILVDEYNKIINDAIFAFDKLKDFGYPQRKVIAVLSDKRLSEWPRAVRRLMSQKKSKS